MLNSAYEDDYRPAKPDPSRMQAHQVDTVLCFGCKDVDAAYEFIKAKGISAAEPKKAPYGMRQLYFQDPDGYGLCFQRPI